MDGSSSAPFEHSLEPSQTLSWEMQASPHENFFAKHLAPRKISMPVTGQNESHGLAHVFRRNLHIAERSLVNSFEDPKNSFVNWF